MVADMRKMMSTKKKLKGKGGDFANTSVDDTSQSKAEEDEKQGGDVVEANADDNFRSSAGT